MKEREVGELKLALKLWIVRSVVKMVGVGQRRDKIREQSRHLQHSIVSARTTDLRQRGKDNTMAERIFFTEGGGTGKKGVESENK